MRSAARFALSAAVTLLALRSRVAIAQTVGAGAIDRFEPAPAGDALFSVASPHVGGHLVPRVVAYFDYAHRPLSLTRGTQQSAIVSSQAVLHVGASLALFDRLLLTASMPIAVEQAGDSPTFGTTGFPSPRSAQAGDLRVGARVGAYGRYWDPFQIAVGANVFVPTGASPSYMGDGAFHGGPQLLLGGRSSYFMWNLELGAMLRAAPHPHSLKVGAGVAFTPWGEVFQIGPEFTLALPFSEDKSFSTAKTTITPETGAAAEALLGVKVRPFIKLGRASGFVLGAAGGPGVTHAIGTPIVRGVGMLAWDPLVPRPTNVDSDGDTVPDSEDACPNVPGVRSSDMALNGCPERKRDRDGDGIADGDDACPFVAGVRSDDPLRNGCPADSDGDGVADDVDACPKVKGVATNDPKTNGCPPKPSVNDADGDGIADADDACPNERGAADPDPTVNGCPKMVRVTDKEIVLLQQVQFLFGQSHLNQTVAPVSDAMLIEVRDAIAQHPEIDEIEVQGHTDSVGTPEYNVGLSQARAEAVRAWLVGRGIPPAKLAARGYGATKPAADNDTAAGRQANRRVQFIISKRSRPGTSR